MSTATSLADRHTPRSGRPCAGAVWWVGVWHGVARRRALYAFASLLSTWAPLARAQAHVDFELTWEAPPHCPQSQAVRTAIERSLREQSEALDADDVRIDARVEADAQGFALDLELESPSGHAQERLRARSCDALVDALALKVTLASTPPGAANGAEVGPRVSRDSAKPELADEPEAAATPTLLFVDVQGGGAAGILPGLSPSVSIGASLQRARLRLALGAAFQAGGRVTYLDLPDVGADFRLMSGSLRACLALLLRPVTLASCAGIELGVLRGSGVGVSPKFYSDQLWAAASLGMALRVPLTGALALALDGQALGAFARPSYHVRDLAPLFHAGALGGRGTLGLELRL